MPELRGALQWHVNSALNACPQHEHLHVPSSDFCDGQRIIEVGELRSEKSGTRPGSRWESADC